MIKTSIGKGKFHLRFKNSKDFVLALSLSYLREPNKRCWAIVSDEDNLIVIQPSVSTQGLNVLILEAELLEKSEIEKVKELLIKEGISTIVADYLRRPSQSQGFMVGFNKKVDNFIKALKIFYFAGKQNRCRVIIPQKGALIIQPSVSTLELNTLVLEDFGLMSGEEKGKVEVVITSLEKIKCDSVLSPFKSTNF